MYVPFTLRSWLGLFVPEFLSKFYDRVVGNPAAPAPSPPDTRPTRNEEDQDLDELVRLEVQMRLLLMRRETLLSRIQKRKTPRSRLVHPGEQELPS